MAITFYIGLSFRLELAIWMRLLARANSLRQVLISFLNTDVNSWETMFGHSFFRARTETSRAASR
jgi:hypothetical protein